MDKLTEAREIIGQADKEIAELFEKRMQAVRTVAEYKRENGKLIFERIIEKFSPEILGVTLDVFWVQVGGGDPAYWLEKLSGRVPCIHLKDYAFDRTMAVLGEGNINFDRVFKEAEAAGTKYMFVEQDDCYGENPFDCLKRSYDYLVSRGF